VLATRLSENPTRSILLLEAGPDYSDPADMPSEIRSGFNPAFHDWGYIRKPGSLGGTIDLPRGKLVAGCFETNADIALQEYRAIIMNGRCAAIRARPFPKCCPFFVALKMMSTSTIVGSVEAAPTESARCFGGSSP
jgi:hypothetical protein